MYLIAFVSVLKEKVGNQIFMVFYNLLLESAVSGLPHLLYWCQAPNRGWVLGRGGGVWVECWDFGLRGIVH